MPPVVLLAAVHAVPNIAQRWSKLPGLLQLGAQKPFTHAAKPTPPGQSLACAQLRVQVLPIARPGWLATAEGVQVKPVSHAMVVLPGSHFA
jgi:hypothetical protein